MKKEIKVFLEKIANEGNEEAKQLLDNNLKEETLNVFDYHLNNYWNKEDFKKAILEKDFAKIIYISVSCSTGTRYINENFVNFPKIVDILYDFVKTQETVESEAPANE